VEYPSTIMPDNRITVLLDTNVFIAGYWSPGSASARIIRACVEGRIQAHYSPQVKAEADKLLRTAKIPDAYIRSLEDFWAAAEEVQGVSAGPVRVEDPDDQKFLEAALGGETDFLVTNDRHLLRIGFIGRTEILPPGRLVRLLG